MNDPSGQARATFTRRLGRYEVRARVGDGGMATVYAGRAAGTASKAPKGLVALKVIKQELSENPEFVAMFLDEAEIVSRLSHPNCVRVFELGAQEGRLFIAMEFLRGQSLWDVWNASRARSARLPFGLVAWIGARAAAGLHHAHEMKDDHGESRRVVHRDVNHTNIFVTYDGEVKIIDFGLAKATGRAVKSAAGVVKGKASYLAPEMVAGKPIDRRADLFSLGATLWELTTDRRLFYGQDDAETIERIYRTRVPDPRTLIDGYPDGLWDILRRALARDPADRYSTAAEMGDALDRFVLAAERPIDGKTLTGVMGMLFAAERADSERWLAEANDDDRPAPEEPLRPSMTRVAPFADEEASQPSQAPPVAQKGEEPPPPQVPSVSRRALTVAPARGRKTWLQSPVLPVSLFVLAAVILAFLLLTHR